MGTWGKAGSSTMTELTAAEQYLNRAAEGYHGCVARA